MYLKMTVHGFTLDAIAQMPVVILKDADGSNTLPIWINTMEAVSLAAELISRDISVESGRSDILTRLLRHLSLKVDRVTIDGLNDGVFDTAIVIAGKGEEIRVDSRPSEALTMVLKYNLPVHIAEEVVAQASMLTVSEEGMESDNDARRFIDFLEGLDPKELGKYPM